MVGEALEEDFEDIVVLSFNPWLFSGVDHLVGVFFEELAAQPLEQRPGEWSKKAGRALQTYGKILGELRAIPAIGYWATLLGKVSEFAGRQSNSTLERASVGCWDDARTLHKAGKR
jgi:hypothetical protein